MNKKTFKLNQYKRFNKKNPWGLIKRIAVFIVFFILLNYSLKELSKNNQKVQEIIENSISIEISIDTIVKD